MKRTLDFSPIDTRNPKAKAPGWNPGNLTNEEVGEDYRLYREGETLDWDAERFWLRKPSGKAREWGWMSEPWGAPEILLEKDGPCMLVCGVYKRTPSVPLWRQLAGTVYRRKVETFNDINKRDLDNWVLLE